MQHTSSESSTRLIGVDWGTSRLRAWRMNNATGIEETRESDDGIGSMAGRSFPETLSNLIGDWADTHPDAPIIASGMVSSRQGWIELDYLRAPVSLDELAMAMGTETMSLPSGRVTTVNLVSGVSCEREDGIGDVMRGEETQMAGEGGHGERIVVLPGTHSKWVMLNDDRLETFRTAMTGEVFAVLCEHTILGALMDGTSVSDPNAFADGVETARRAEGRILDLVFGARTGVLTQKFTDTATASWLSGLLIGGEIATAVGGKSRIASVLNDMREIRLIGDGALVGLYEKAAIAFEVQTLRIDPHVTAIGHWQIAERKGLIDDNS